MDDRLAFLLQPLADTPVGQQHYELVFGHREPIGGLAALHYFPPRGALRPAHLVLFVLGNPGLLDYYVPFLTHLGSLLPPDFGIIATSHIGHTPGVPGPSAPLDLASQLEAKVELVRALRSALDALAGTGTDTRACLVLAGHSVGAWLTCEIMKCLPAEVDEGFLIFPTLGWIANSWNGWMLWPIFHWPALPLLSAISPLLRPILPLTNFPAPTLALLRSPATIHHALRLGTSEMATIRAPDLAWFAAHKARLGGVWSADKDGWVGKDGPAVRATLAGGRVEVLNGVPHAFCLTQAHSEQVAEIIARWIAPEQDIQVEEHKAPMPLGGNTVPM
ncbi:hypothetical protein Q5752_000761 [Cryptotrichosporon argae]